MAKSSTYRITFEIDWRPHQRLINRTTNVLHADAFTWAGGG
jgi:hypothetical protein